MKNVMTVSILAALCVLGSAFVLTGGPAQAGENDLSAQLHGLIDKLTPAQQEALLVLLGGSQAAPQSAPQSARDAAVEVLEQFTRASDAGEADFAPFYARISNDFRHWAVGGKEGAVEWIEGMAPGLFKDGKSLMTFDLDDMEVEEDGDTATAYPIDVNTPLGRVTLEITAQREADGVWRITGIDGL